MQTPVINSQAFCSKFQKFFYFFCVSHLTFLF
nr:MAG TPA: hypothetical protein [Caudoviricetes sp.]